ncbi:MAG: hypothetical protein JKY48_17590 [Flavobacteriales bacterium]|nr:hypothetical protein [Flavobacteriales bacterium]
MSNLCDPQVSEGEPFENLIPSCEDEMAATAEYSAKIMYRNYLDSVKQSFREDYIRKCLNTYEEFNLNFEEDEHHYTLYYYDQAGNLVRTVPPKGVKKLASTEFEAIREDRMNNSKLVFNEHEMATTYAYNSLGQLV